MDSNNLKIISEKTGISVEEIEDAFKKNVFSFKDINDISEIQRTYFLAIELEKAAFKRWNELALINLSKKNTTDEIQKALDISPPDSQAESTCLKKLILSSNNKELIEFLETIYSGSDMRKEVIKKICENYEKGEI